MRFRNKFIMNESPKAKSFPMNMGSSCIYMNFGDLLQNATGKWSADDFGFQFQFNTGAFKDDILDQAD